MRRTTQAKVLRPTACSNRASVLCVAEACNYEGAALIAFGLSMVSGIFHNLQNDMFLPD